MCNTNTGIRFCTCLTKEDAPAKTGSKLGNYKWHLTRFKGLDDSGIMGSIVGPSSDLGQGLSAEAILRVLNEGSSFDFAYQPEEKDCLRLTSAVPGSYYEYMSFLYDGHQWIQGMNPPFTTRSEEIAKGDVFKLLPDGGK
jgi:hypothetical protein